MKIFSQMIPPSVRLQTLSLLQSTSADPPATAKAPVGIMS